MIRPFVIKFEQLSLGSHDFNFDINMSIFNHVEEDEIKDALFHVEMHMLKSETMMNMHFHYVGNFIVPCDRCNKEMIIEIDEKSELIVKYGQAEHEEFDELIVLAANEYEIDLKHYLYESLSLLLPQRRVHEEKACDQEILRMLQYTQNETANNQLDPRWEKLKNI